MKWQQATMNGGGFIAGILQNPHHPDVMYARSDVAGVFKSEDRGKSWRSINNGMTDAHQHDVQTFAISPHHPHILFRCSGSVRGHQFFGTIHKTTDGGENWYAVCTQADFYGNGETRQYGEMIKVSPHNPNWVVAGAYSGGVWMSDDEGETWHHRGLTQERISCVAFHPTLPNTVYIGTLGSYDKNPRFVRQQYDFVRPNPARLYRSDDAGKSWQVLCEGLDFSQMVFHPDDPNRINAACIKNGVMRSVDGGYTWHATAPHLSKYDIGTLSIDPKNPNRIVAAAMTFPNFDPDVPPIGVYETLDAGKTWSLIRWHTPDDLVNYPNYMTLEYAGWAIAKILIDQDDSQRLYITNWYGVAISLDAGKTWDANHFAGMENICIENMTPHPTDPKRMFMVSADHTPKYSTDGGCTYAPLPRPETATMQGDGTAIVASRHTPDMILYAVKGSKICSIVRTHIGDENPQVVLSLTGKPDTAPSELALQSRATGISVQALIESPHTAGTFYAYMDGLFTYGAGVYRTTDNGDTWQRLANPFPDYMIRIPYEREWIENELLSVVVAQTKNVCGTNQLFCADSQRKDTLYVGEWTEGVYRTDDGGASWVDISAGLPFGWHHTAVLNVLRAHPTQAGVLFAGFIREGVWRSDDFGASWHKIYPTDKRVFNATSIAISRDGMGIAVVCEPLTHSPCLSAVMLSRDGGNTWDAIYDPRLGAIRWKTVAFSCDDTRLHAGSCGNSAFFYAVR